MEPERTLQTDYGASAMGQSLVQIYVHVVFSTKSRIPFLKDLTHRERLHAYLASNCTNLDSPTIIVGGVDDHVHLLCRLGKTVDISRLVRELKKASSEWTKHELAIKDFHWQAGYGAFSVSPSHIATLTEYIANQLEHHRQESFQDEFRRLCAKYGVPIDERYVWD